jgi:hypothetical protein
MIRCRRSTKLSTTLSAISATSSMPALSHLAGVLQRLQFT